MISLKITLYIGMLCFWSTSTTRVSDFAQHAPVVSLRLSRHLLVEVICMIFKFSTVRAVSNHYQDANYKKLMEMF